MLNIDQIYAKVDGSLECNTAATFNEYRIDTNLTRDGKNIGLTYFDEDRLANLVAALQNLDKFGQTGFDFVLEACGDRAVNLALNAVEHAKRKSKKRSRSSRHRISGCEIVHRDIVAKLAFWSQIWRIRPNLKFSGQNTK